ncbi:glycosyltransferase family 2 protein [Pseudooceanicola sediminis]|uniref:Glycosyltransferase family 2 protein n=1 Tax=Pseudooceanicola sediminis TaxID=2211117 RepID=A0A399J1Z9_9RHOB|nr:glycosyltransferase family 2 protein [Pseudooceanicola sediminis]KAA2314626.1 glycosyltransferase family 2 protein [Puniceibacterium sp. HSS470]RII39418.1 glycosyltransferase family 2 protein [Pseudooceanicola sediminis]|tara:strand:+ start:3298 stop:4110 length:813 start_codon:yes stop_codon:yes gene_type:complete
MSLPYVTVIIPAYRAADTLPAALASIRTCGLPPDQVEVIIASDDGQDYATRFTDPMLAFTPVGPVRSGAGPARNRALAQARGNFIAYLDADDTWSPGYLAALVPLARRHGAAFGLTSVYSDGKELMQLPRRDGFTLSLEDFGATGASYHPVLERHQARPFTNQPSQDVRHAVELLARLGGTAPLGQARYCLNLNPDSATADGTFARRVGLAYQRHIAQIEAGEGDIPDAMRARCAQVFRDKDRLNHAFTNSATPGLSYYDFVAAWQQDRA